MASQLKKVKLHDFDTYQHCERVAHIAVFIGICIQLSRFELKSLQASAFLHDIGKIQIPKKILNKPGGLTDSEYTVVKKHPEDGSKIISQDFNFPNDVIAGIITHHEHFNGDGYPFGVSGEDIHHFGRIITIADAFDAMVNPRTYKAKTMRPVEALLEIIEYAGRQFDPYIVKKIENQSPQAICEGILGFAAYCK